jgi:hypothetical protein
VLGERFLHVQVGTSLEHQAAGFRVSGWWRHDMDDVNAAVKQEGPQGAIGADAGKSRSERLQGLRRRVRHGDDAAPRLGPGYSSCVVVGHPSRAGNCDAQDILWRTQGAVILETGSPIMGIMV